MLVIAKYSNPDHLAEIAESRELAIRLNSLENKANVFPPAFIGDTWDVFIVGMASGSGDTFNEAATDALEDMERKAA